MSKPKIWSLEKLLRADLGRAVVWASPKVVSLVNQKFPEKKVTSLDELPPDLETLIVIGGGVMIDSAKAWRHNVNRNVQLVAIPSIWGSGAEASPVVVLDQNGDKKIFRGTEYLPDIRCVWPELAQSIPDPLARNACGDTWAHALEGFLSPLANNELRTKLAKLLREMIKLPLANNPQWFELSARACAGQSRSSVGLVHGIAHVLEGPLRAEQPDMGWSHAKLCSVFLWPVMRLNQTASGKWSELMNQYGLNSETIMGILKELFDEEAYNKAKPLMSMMWRDILKDPCTRTNSVVVRPGHLSHFITDKGIPDSHLLSKSPYGPRDNATLLDELNALTRHHLEGCPEYARIWGANWQKADSFEEIPYLHVGIFKQMLLRTQKPGIQHKRTLKSSATTTGVSSLVALDRQSSRLQSASTLAILKEFVGEKIRPLLILDSAQSLRTRDEISARVAAAMSLRPLSSEIHFLLEDLNEPTSMKWDTLSEVLSRHDEFMVYGFTWILWLAWVKAKFPDRIQSALRGKRIYFVHSGGWKKLEAIKVDRSVFNGALLKGLASGSQVVDFYGVVEQVGIIYPLCENGYRHVPVWAHVIVRNPFTLRPVVGEIGQLQLLNSISLGSPYHSVLTEDLGRIVEDACGCGRSGRRFQLHGRIPEAEIRGCSNV